MRILLVTPMPPQPEAAGAIPLVLHAQLSALRPRHAVTLVTVVGPDPGEAAAVAALRRSGLDVHALPLMRNSRSQRWQRRGRMTGAWLQGRLPWRSIWFWEPGLQGILNRLLRENIYDLVQVEDNAMGVYQYGCQVPLIMTEHEVRRPRPLEWHGWSGGKPLHWLLAEVDWQRWRRYQIEVWSRFRLIQVFTQRDASMIHTMAPHLADRVRVNPFGVAVPAQADAEKEKAGTLIFVGNFTHPPNVDAALWLGHEIMPRLRRQWPGVRLTLVGIYPPEAVQKLACEDIVVTGVVPAIEPYLEEAALILAPLRIGGGMRMKVLYAMGMGKAVVTTSRGAEGLTDLGDQPPLIVADHADDLATAVVGLLASARDRHALGQRARDFVSHHFSPAAYARRLELTYAELLASPFPNQVAE